MLKIKKIIRTLVVFTAAIASISLLSVSGYATSRVIYKPASGYKRLAFTPTYGVIMSYSVNTTKQSATCSYKFDDGAGIPSGNKQAYIRCEYILPNDTNTTTIYTKTSGGNSASSLLPSKSATVALTENQISAGYKIQFLDFRINCTSDTYNPFWFPSYK